MPSAQPLDDEPHRTAFEERFGPTALFGRYAHVRIREFPVRQVPVLLATIFVGLVISPLVAMLGGGLAVLGELVDILVLHHGQRALARGTPIKRVLRWSTVSAIFQAVTISVAMQMMLFQDQSDAAVQLSFCLLMAASINAGFTLTHHGTAAYARLCIYALTVIGYFIVDIRSAGQIGSLQATNMLIALTMGFMTVTFVTFTVTTWRRRTRKELALLSAAADLDAANQELASSQKEMRELSLVAKHANDSVIIFDPNLRILWVNDTFTKLTGYSRDEAVGQKPWHLLGGPRSDREVSDGFVAAVREKRSWRARMLNYRKDGEAIWLDINRVPVIGPNGAVETLISVERDVTQEIRRERELAEAIQRAEDGARAKSIFLATMSHEIRTPLNAIIGMADILADSTLSGEKREYVDTIRSASNALLTIINDVLELSRLDADKVAFEALPFSPGQCIDDCAQLLRPMADEKGLELIRIGTDRLTPLALGDAGRVRQILVNLLGNAVKFTETGSVTLRAATERDGSGWRLTVDVEDTGIGVPPERAEQIFEEFQQADAATTRRFGGTGLGLPISRALARRMGGDIVLMPAGDRQGSCFRLTLRLGRARQTDQLVAGQDADTLTLPPGMSILLAEDNATNRLLIRRFLRDQEVDLHEAENGREAVEMTADIAPDAILMDMSMPELDGLEATRAIRLLDMPQPRIIALTANAFASDREACIGAGMDDFLAKPVRRKQLLAALIQAGPVEKPLSNPSSDGVSRPDAAKGTPSWTSPPGSGTTSGESIRSSDR